MIRITQDSQHMKTKTKYIDYVWKFLEGELSGEELKIFKDELKTNYELNRVYQEQSEIFKALQKTETIELRKQLSNIVQEPKAPYNVRSSFNSRMLLYLAAASVVIILSLGYIILNYIANDNRSSADFNKQIVSNEMQSEIVEEDQLSKDSYVYNPSNDQNNDSNLQFYPAISYFDTTTDVKYIYDELLAVVYQENPMLESLLDLNYRSDLIDLYLPEPEQSYTFDDTIVFYWKPEVDTSLYLTIINNRSIEIFYTKLKGKHLVFNQKLSPGLYYWKINTDRENLFNGKIVIK